MKLLVTGVAGFIGSNFAYHLLAADPAARIVGLDKLTYAGNYENLTALTPEARDRFFFVKGDINDRALVEGLFAEHTFDGVVNFAAESHVDRAIEDSQVFLATNVLGTQNLLDVARRLGARPGPRFLQVSTDEVYGELGPSGMFTEETPLAPRNPYSASKAAADHLALSFHHTYGMPVLITRCSNNYGPYQFPEKLIPLMIRNALRHEALPVYGDGKHVRDWLYVRDHCRAVEMVLGAGTPGRVYNIGGNNERENLFVVKKLLSVLRERTGDPGIGEGLIRHIEDRPGHDRRYAIDATRIRTELGWEPQVPFEEGIERTIDWYLAHAAWTERVISGEYLRFYERNYAGR